MKARPEPSKRQRYLIDANNGRSQANPIYLGFNSRGMTAIRYQAIFHLNEDDDEKVKTTLSNIENLIDDLGRINVEVILVVNRKGVKVFEKGSSISQRVEKLRKLGVTFKICANSLASRGMVKEDLIDQVDIVGSGIGEIVRKQVDGWAYVKP
jgi:intracellular sulfur oxidation DsrE/DsrF family protein